MDSDGAHVRFLAVTDGADLIADSIRTKTPSVRTYSGGLWRGCEARLKQAREAHELAESKLVSGRGNVIGQAEMLWILGVNVAKSLPATLTAVAVGVGFDEVDGGAPRCRGLRLGRSDKAARG